MREQFRDLAWILFYEHGPNAHIECFEFACKLCSHDSQVLDLVERTCRRTFSGIGNWWT